VHSREKPRQGRRRPRIASDRLTALRRGRLASEAENRRRLSLSPLD
jgi:hypothetical protein